jgi:hypothetical protein
MGHPQVRWSLQLMTQDGGKTEQFQGDCERRLGFTTKSDGICFLSLRLILGIIDKAHREGDQFSARAKII